MDRDRLQQLNPVRAPFRRARETPFPVPREIQPHGNRAMLREMREAQRRERALEEAQNGGGGPADQEITPEPRSANVRAAGANPRGSEEAGEVSAPEATTEAPATALPAATPKDQAPPSTTTTSPTTESPATSQGPQEINRITPDIGGEPRDGIQIDQLALDSAVERVTAAIPAELQGGSERHVEAILRQAFYHRITDPNQVAYLLATAEHESQWGHPRLPWGQPFEEEHNRFNQVTTQRRGPRRGQVTEETHWQSQVHTNGRRVRGDTREALETNYWESAYGGRNGNVSRREDPTSTDARDFRGRGYTQLTFRSNYEQMNNRLRTDGFRYRYNGVEYGTPQNPIDITRNPDHVSRVPELSARVLVSGAHHGMFRPGNSLSTHIRPGQPPDFVGARDIINAGGDRARDVAAIARRYAPLLQRHWDSVYFRPPNGQQGEQQPTTGQRGGPR